jgi:large subunit ribosomal protein L5
MESLKKKYEKEVVPAMMERFGYKNKMAVPAIKKIVLNTSFGKMVATKGGSERDKISSAISQDLSLIGGQAATLTESKKSIAGFKLREGLQIGAVITLRKQRMWDFLERLIYLSLPRSRDFKGLNMSGVDKQGNFSMGFKEHISFPEISTEKEKAIFGLQITVVTNAKNKEQGLALYELLGFPAQETNKK